jgi:hypothetical protein
VNLLVFIGQASSPGLPLNPPGAFPRRPPPLFETEGTALAHAAEVRKMLENAEILSEDRDILLRDYAGRRLDVWTHEIAARTHRLFSRAPWTMGLSS